MVAGTWYGWCDKLGKSHSVLGKEGGLLRIFFLKEQPGDVAVVATLGAVIVARAGPLLDHALLDRVVEGLRIVDVGDEGEAHAVAILVDCERVCQVLEVGTVLICDTFLGIGV